MGEGWRFREKVGGIGRRLEVKGEGRRFRERTGAGGIGRRLEV